MYESAMEPSFDERWATRGGNIQQHEDVAHAAGRALRQEEGGQMANGTILMAGEESYADGFCNGYMPARKESLKELKSAVSNSAPDVANTLSGKIIAEGTTSYQLLVEALERFA